MMNISYDILIVLIGVNLLLWVILLQRFKTLNRKLLTACLLSMSEKYRVFYTRWRKMQSGMGTEALIKAKIAEKLADRAFSLASSANLATMHLQRILQTRPKIFKKEELILNEIAQDKVMETVGGSPNYAGFDWLYPILSQEERDILDNAMEHAAKYKQEGNGGVEVNAGNRSTT